MASGSAAVLDGQKYINLETLRKDGRAVVTPVWFTMDGQDIAVITKSDTGKVKRIRNNSAVRIMPSGFRGEPKGEWMSGKARFADPEELKRAMEQRRKKYGFRASLASVVSSGRGSPVAILITLV